MDVGPSGDHDKKVQYFFFTVVDKEVLKKEVRVPLDDNYLKKPSDLGPLFQKINAIIRRDA